MPKRTKIKVSKKQALAIGLLIAVGILWYEGYAIERCFNTRSWDQTRGEIVSSSLERHGNYKGRHYHPAIRYRYSVDGRNYKNDQVNFGGYDRVSRYGKMVGWTSSTLSTYPVGKSVTVYYNPTNPSDSVLERGLPLSGYVLVVIGVAMMCMTGTSLTFSKIKD